MWYCQHCKELFETPAYEEMFVGIRKLYERDGTPTVDRVCPSCGDNRICKEIDLKPDMVLERR